MKPLSAILVLAVVVQSCAARSAILWQQHDRRIESLEREKDKLRRISDAVDRTKTEIKISEILLTLVADAVKSGDLETMEQRLDQYAAAIQDAHETMVKTGRDAHKNPKGFKELEIALRRQVRQLDDIGVALNFDEREPVTKAKEKASDIRDDLLKALFGSQNVAPRKS
jgi:hypothetical protein